MDAIMEQVLALALRQQEGGEGGETAAPQEGGQTQPADPQGENQPAPEGGFLSNPLWLMLAIMLVMYFFIFRSPRKRQEQQMQKMRASLQRNARVRTIGGIIGTVVDVRDEEVVIKIDETNNTKMRVTIGAIGKVLADEEETAKSK
jgi:preprotein translocase subunit YajC